MIGMKKIALLAFLLHDLHEEDHADEHRNHHDDHKPEPALAGPLTVLLQFF
jgi:hypothetical protein